ncbi:ubiquitin carboxyl-terminal hydrolase 25 [Phalaenopsis equestris]|uniref:ubiquitin carboxyl-terminal hydrolase 25 n=1 Tax=Phalaenopsis equestris TaxID=78828 RepID=UPI0009E64C39|nr:ubiquitin carboxyl-terminal hydrolase 25 [Phalaenopsis equestris]
MMGLQMAWQQCVSERRRPPLGLKNLGNSCYLNSVLQCLTYTPPLAQFCLSSEHSSLCKRLFANKEKECPFCILERQIARSLKLDGHLDTPSKIQRCLNVFAEHFRWGRQEDAHEFLRYVIDACHNTCLKILKRRSTVCNGSNINGTGVKLKKEEPSGTSTIMNQIFGGSLLSQLKCLSCKGESNKADEIMDVSLDLYESNSLREALSRFFRAEVLDGNNKYSCERCKKLSVAKKQLFILRAPNVLVIQLKRFEGVHGGKINRCIEFEEILELSNYMYKSCQESEPKYSLFGSIVHSGYSPESGHYYAYIKDAFGRWYCCNDAHVSLSSTQEVLSEKVYILFYLRCDQHQKSAKAGSACDEVKAIVSNRSSTATSLKTAETSKSLATANAVPLPKNGKISAYPQVRPITSKNFGTPGLLSNGDENHDSCVDGKNNDAKQSLAIDKNTLQTELHLEELGTDNMDDSSVAGKNSVIVTNQAMQSLPNGNGRCRSPLRNPHEDNANSRLLNGRKDPRLEHSCSTMLPNRQNSLISSKRKLEDREKKDDVISYAEKSPVLSSNEMKHTLEELQKFKEILASEALSVLRSCDWFGKVHDFMRVRKRSCVQAAGGCPNNAELKKDLINSARENFIQQIPGSLKGRLIELLKTFSQSNSLLDA